MQVKPGSDQRMHPLDLSPTLHLRAFVETLAWISKTRDSAVRIRTTAGTALPRRALGAVVAAAASWQPAVAAIDCHAPSPTFTDASYVETGNIAGSPTPNCSGFLWCFQPDHGSIVVITFVVADSR